MASEKEWVKCLQPELQRGLVNFGADGWRIEVCTGEKLTYAHEILLYRTDGLKDDRSVRYETDLLVRDIRENGDWIPRVVLECKLGSITTHDALTYSTKAATHKHVHPYLRYGILIGAFGTALPGRLIRHGAFFDFMMAWQADGSSAEEGSELSELIALLGDEVRASRTLQVLLTDRTRGRQRFRLLHRPLRLTESRD